MDLRRLKQRRPKEQSIGDAETGQLHPSSITPFDRTFNSYKPLKENLGLFREIRRAIPFIDVGITKRSKLIGTFQFDAKGKSSLQMLLNDFKENVRVNVPISKGLDSFLMSITEPAFELGDGYGEILLNEQRTKFHSLSTAKTEDIYIVKDPKRGNEWAYATKKTGYVEPVPVEHQDQVIHCAWNHRDGSPHGTSILLAMPFVAQILIKIEKSWENMAVRFGDPSLAIIAKGGKGETSTGAKKIVDKLKAQFKLLYKGKYAGQTGDVFAAVGENGDVDIKVIGENAKVVISDISVRTILEQVVTVLDLPPSYLGISWATTERMSTNQAKMLISNVDSERALLNQLIRKITDMFLIYSGQYAADYDIIWDDVDLIDTEILAKARLQNAMAGLKILETFERGIKLGIFDESNAENYLISQGIDIGQLPKGWYAKATTAELVKNLMRQDAN